MARFAPKLAQKLLASFLKDQLLEEVLGDLEEKFQQVRDKRSYNRAVLNYWFQVFQYFRPFAIKSLKNSNYLIMNRHHLLIGFRILIKNKAFATLNIGGLALGMIVALLIGLWIHDEFSFDKNHNHYHRIAQVVRYDGEDDAVYTSQVSKLSEFLSENYANYFEQVAVTFYRNGEELLTKGNNTISETGYFFDKQVGELLSLKMISGTYEAQKPDEILISSDVAAKFYKNQNAIGEVLELNGSVKLRIKGVFQSLPTNSTFQDAQFFVSMDLIYNENNPRTWDNFNTRTYVLLRENAQIKAASEAIKDVLKNNSPNGQEQELFLHPMANWRLYSEFEGRESTTSQRLQFVGLYAVIALFVLILACINFMNLNTARYHHRGKEVGIRKTIGSRRIQLIYQFLFESLLYAFAAFTVSLLATWTLLPWFNDLSAKTLTIPFSEVYFWVICVAFVLVTGFAAGSYPAFLLSSFRPLPALQGVLRQGATSRRLREMLVGFQFIVSIALIIGTVVVYQQIVHVKNRYVGYDQQGVISVRARTSAFLEKFDVLATELKRNGLITEASTANYPLTNTLGNNDIFSIGDRTLDVSFNTITVNSDYGRTTNWDLKAGRDFNGDVQDESSSVIVSELAARKMGLDNPVGTIIYADREFNGRRSWTIIGVVGDMIKGSPFEAPMPLMVFHAENPLRWAFFKMTTRQNPSSSLPKMQDLFEEIIPGHPFAYSFLQQEYAAKFREEERVGSLAAFFSTLAILVSCLGLFGLSAFMMESRTKEIGIRKTLGATTSQLWKLLSLDFARPILVACVLAVPLASQVMTNWLAGYEYRIELSWGIFAFAVLISFVVALGTVSIHSLRAAVANPVKALRSE